MHIDQRRIASLLLTNRNADASFWRWIQPGQRLSRKDANKFLLGSILDYQILAKTAWENARRLSEDILGDPEDLWQTITSGPLPDWISKRTQYSLHRFPKGHERVYTIGKRIVAQYEGDARNIWHDESIEATLYRLNDLGVGKQLSSMVVGALVDVGLLRGKADVKVDRHVRRVLGRLFRGEEFSSDQTSLVVELTRSMHPENPWLLDRPLYSLGQSLCVAGKPKCPSCFMRAACVYANSVA
jgi:endonuclease III